MSAADLVDDRYSTMVPPRRWVAAVDGQRLAGLSLPHQRTSGGGGGGGEGGSDGDGPERRVLWVGFGTACSRASLLSSDSRESCSF